MTLLVTPFDLASYCGLVELNSGTGAPSTDIRGQATVGTYREWGPLEYNSTLAVEARAVSPFDLASYSGLVELNSGTGVPSTDLRGTAVQGTYREWGPLEYDATLILSGGIQGVVDVTQADDALSATGILPVFGALLVTEAGNVLLADGIVSLSGVLSVAQADDSLSAVGNLSIYGQFVIEQFGDTLVTNGSLALAGEIILVQFGDTLSASGGVVNSISAVIMQADNTLLAGMVLNRFRSRYRGTVRSIGNIRINEV